MMGSPNTKHLRETQQSWGENNKQAEKEMLTVQAKVS